ncbi:MAG: gliding motility-associated C-terminal domain-containing protein [Sphingobacteriales bacterium]|nr:MAG: gliding motility-associated C-terminal domain-containing protein [Sphingobacteriales bacterium]
MVKHLALFLALTLPFSSFAQNLVPNPGFETMNNCPNNIGTVDFSPTYSSFPTVDAWISPMQSGSPDYFNSCATIPSGVHVPESTFGYQYARTGNAYMGIIAWQGTVDNGSWKNVFHEYIQTKLLTPMVPGERYCVAFYVSPSVSPAFTNFNYVSLDEVGINFSATQTTATTGYNLALPYSVVNTPGNYILDTGGWVRINAIYTATGGEQWMTVGVFDHGSAPNFTQAYPIPANSGYDTYRSYMYFDDFSVVKIGPSDTEKIVHQIGVCDTGNISLDVNSSGVDGTYKWLSGETTKKLNITKTGVYWCKSDADCHFYIDTFKVYYDPNVTLTLGRDTGDCNNQPIIIKANNAGFNNFLWNTGETTEEILVTQSGKYFLAAENQCGQQSDSINVYIQGDTPPPVLRDTSICQFSDQVMIPADAENITWYSSKESIIGNPYQPYLYTKKPGDNVIYATQKIGYCESDKAEMHVTVKYTPQEELQDRITMCEKYRIDIGNDVPDVIYKWSTGESVCCILPYREGVYRRATTNECGTYIDSVNVTMSECDQCIMVPNAFSPNRDGKNDKFKAIVTCPIDRFEMNVYNRWGNKVFSTTSIDEGWDGSYKGIPAEGGTYIYVLEYRSSSTFRTNTIKGNITLFR